MDLFNYQPRASRQVRVGNRPLGGGQPIRLQSMTTRPTTDTAGCVEQAIRIFDAGADYVRLTTQGTREAENLRAIRDELRRRGYDRPLVADVHFNPNVADVAAAIVEKVRINPGNYVDPARTFKHLEYTDEEYAAELRRLEERFGRLLAVCREHGTALRIGVNHGSLSDRIMSRYGDTPAGIVESCMEFLRVCVREDFRDVVVSIKASNTVVMVRSVRLLCDAMRREGMDFPLHLGVTEAGEGEDGRIKSAAGIGALLADGIGDTIRVSLSEEPEREVPVAYKLAAYVVRSRSGHAFIPAEPCPLFDYLNPVRRATCPAGPFGGGQVPVVISVRLDGSAATGSLRPDFVYCGAHLPAAADRIPGAGYIVDAAAWTGEENTYPAYPPHLLMTVGACGAPLKFLFLSYPLLTDEVRACLRLHPEMVPTASASSARWSTTCGTPAYPRPSSSSSSTAAARPARRISSSAPRRTWAPCSSTGWRTASASTTRRPAARGRSPMPSRTRRPSPSSRPRGHAPPRRSTSAARAAGARSTTCPAPSPASRPPRPI